MKKFGKIKYIMLLAIQSIGFLAIAMIPWIYIRYSGYSPETFTWIFLLVIFVLGLCGFIASIYFIGQEVKSLFLENQKNEEA